MNLFSLMPADIREAANRIEPKYDGPWHDESTGESGMTVEWWTDETSSGDPNTRFVSWDELGTTEELYDDYGAILNKPYHPNSRYSGSIFTASWGESPRQFDLPDVHICCDMVLTESGYVGLSDHSRAGYPAWWFGPAIVVSSSDGEVWEERGPLAGEETWVNDIRAVNSGVLAVGSVVDKDDSMLGYDPELTPGPVYWLGTTDAAEWQAITLPEGTTLIKWLMAHDRAPIDWPHIAVNGNIVLRISYDGRIDRYVVPQEAVRLDVSV